MDGRGASAITLLDTLLPEPLDAAWYARRKVQGGVIAGLACCCLIVFVLAGEPRPPPPPACVCWRGGHPQTGCRRLAAGPTCIGEVKDNCSPC